MFSPCKIGWHNWEIFNDTPKIKAELEQYLLEQGFIKKGKDYKYYCNDGIVIEEWGFHDYETLNSCIPDECITKVCVDCGKIKLTYNPESCMMKLKSVIETKTAEFNKRKKAEQILKENYK